MNMTRLKISKTLLAVTLGSILVSSSVLAETNTMDNVQSTANSAGKKSIAL
jgi:hyperosmotically inducible protein